VALIVAPAAFAASITGDKLVHPRQRVSLTVRGFEPGSKLDMTAVPAALLGSNSGGRSLGTRHADGNGRVEWNFRWPSRYVVCRGASRCDFRRWPRNGRVTLFLAAFNGGRISASAQYSAVVR
jgi:hypothetical protein